MRLKLRKVELSHLNDAFRSAHHEGPINFKIDPHLKLSSEGKILLPVYRIVI
jgi:hypothetical protein